MSRSKTLKVLIIDDSVSTRRIYRRFIEGQKLHHRKIEVLEAGSAAEGVHAVKGTDLHCILLDFKLPDRNGLEVLGEVRSISDVPIIFVTGQPNPLTQTQAYQAGINRFIGKDFVSSTSLLSLIEELVSEGDSK